MSARDHDQQIIAHDPLAALQWRLDLAGEYDEGMDGKRQFSLGYLMLEVFWVSLAIGLTRHVVLAWRWELMADEKLILGAAIIADILIIPIAISGLAGRMRAGAVCGFALLVLLGIWALFLPAVQ